MIIDLSTASCSGSSMSTVYSLGSVLALTGAGVGLGVAGGASEHPSQGFGGGFTLTPRLSPAPVPVDFSILNLHLDFNTCSGFLPFSVATNCQRGGAMLVAFFRSMIVLTWFISPNHFYASTSSRCNRKKRLHRSPHERRNAGLDRLWAGQTVSMTNNATNDGPRAPRRHRIRR